MWNSPHTFSENGKRYELKDLAALVLPLDELLDLTTTSPVAEHVSESILQRMERSEFVYALYELFEALTSDVPIPDGGHPGVHQALIAELLNQSFDNVVAEIEGAKMDYDGIDFGEGDFSVRKFVWKSVDRFVLRGDYYGEYLPECLEKAGIKLSDEEIYCSDKLTIEHWEDLLNEDSLGAEFLDDDDWRMDSLLDLHPAKAKRMTKLIGLNLAVVHALPHTPTAEELEMAESYLWKLIRKSDGREEIALDLPDSEFPF